MSRNAESVAVELPPLTGEPWARLLAAAVASGCDHVGFVVRRGRRADARVLAWLAAHGLDRVAAVRTPVWPGTDTGATRETPGLPELQLLRLTAGVASELAALLPDGWAGWDGRAGVEDLFILHGERAWAATTPHEGVATLTLTARERERVAAAVPEIAEVLGAARSDDEAATTRRRVLAETTSRMLAETRRERTAVIGDDSPRGARRARARRAVEGPASTRDEEPVAEATPSPARSARTTAGQAPAKTAKTGAAARAATTAGAPARAAAKTSEAPKPASRAATRSGTRAVAKGAKAPAGGGRARG